MAGRGKSKQVCSKGLSQRLKEDRISQLPDPLICQILSHLPTKVAVKTSVLSTRWRQVWLWVPRLKGDRISQLPDPLICQILSHLPTKEAVTTSVLSTRWRSIWLWLPCLELSSRKFPHVNAFMSFGDRFFDSKKASCIDKVKLSIGDIRFKKGVHDDDDPSYPSSWIDAAVKRKIQHLHVWFHPNTSYELPPRLYTCETLVSSKLFEVNLDNVDFVSLPCLKTMHLQYIWFRKKVFERLVSCCPVLEELKIYGCVYDKAKVFRVFSRSLMKLRIKIHPKNQDFGSGFVIDAPRLCFLRINDNLSESFIIHDMDSNAKLDISLSFGLNFFDEASISSRRGSIPSFLFGVSKIRDMTICRDTFKLICQYSKLEPLPQFGYMSHLWVSLRVSDLNWLPTFLEGCPNLKSLILVWNSNSKKMMHSDELCDFNFSSVPECLLSSLEFIDIKTSISGHYTELNLVQYFLENSPILKQLTLRLNYYCTNVKYIVKEILEIPRRSITCKFVIY